jgi:hypothetical protein
MYAVAIDQPTISGCYVPLDVGLASSAEAVFSFRTSYLSVRPPCSAELNLALFDVDTPAQVSAVRDGDAAALESYWTRCCRTCGAFRSERLNDRQRA